MVSNHRPRCWEHGPGGAQLYPETLGRTQPGPSPSPPCTTGLSHHALLCVSRGASERRWGTCPSGAAMWTKGSQEAKALCDRRGLCRCLLPVMVCTQGRGWKVRYSQVSQVRAQLTCVGAASGRRQRRRRKVQRCRQVSLNRRASAEPFCREPGERDRGTAWQVLVRLSQAGT